MDMMVKVSHEGSVAVAIVDGREVSCLIGRTGAITATDKREGDGKTPLGKWRALYGYYRADRVAKPAGALEWRAMTPDDGWCDASDDERYNQPVPVGYPASHEVMWRADTAYDYVLVLDHNTPAVAGMGSAIFVHVWDPRMTCTAGCVALKREDLDKWLGGLAAGDRVIIG